MSSGSFRTFLHGGSFASINRLSLISHLLHCIKNTLILTPSISTARRPLCLRLLLLLHTSQNSDVGQTYTKRRNRLAMHLQIRYRTRNQLRTINLPSGRLQTSLYRADRLAKES